MAVTGPDVDDTGGARGERSDESTEGVDLRSLARSLALARRSWSAAIGVANSAARRLPCAFEERAQPGRCARRPAGSRVRRSRWRSARHRRATGETGSSPRDQGARRIGAMPGRASSRSRLSATSPAAASHRDRFGRALALRARYQALSARIPGFMLHLEAGSHSSEGTSGQRLTRRRAGRRS